jgi:hypothetical protein
MNAVVTPKLAASLQTPNANVFGDLQRPKLLDMQDILNRGLVSELNITPTAVDGTYRIVARSISCSPGATLVSAYLSLKSEKHDGRIIAVGIISNLEDPTGNEDPELAKAEMFRSLRREVLSAAGDLLEIGRKQLRALGAEYLHLEDCPSSLEAVAVAMGLGKK